MALQGGEITGETGYRAAMETSGAPLAQALRFPPGTDLRVALETHAKVVPLLAAGIVSVVGSLTVARIRMAGAEEIRELPGPLEILSLSGTLGAEGAHLHIMVSDREGTCTGGHLCPGSTVHTTAEVVLLQLPGLRFAREHDARTGYPELAIHRIGRGTGTPPDV